MKHLALAALLAACSALLADHPQDKTPRKATLLDGLGNIHHPVSTSVPEAQKFFDQGLRLLYAFNHDEAHLAFARAAELDPKLAMAHWGMALAVGPNYNLDAVEAQLKAAYGSIQKALELSKDAPAHERAYIEALAKRYAADPAKADKKQLAQAYNQAMGELSKRYPDDLDAATLHAESAMNLRPWDLWSLDGKPAPGTEEIVAVLEGVLRRNPDHTGANHLYIHAVEASRSPERALASAERLKTLAPAAGHLVHMPAHIYIRVGDFAEAVRSNEKAAAADQAYIAKYNVQGVYPLMYYSHNLHFLAVGNAMQGRFEDAKAAADKLAAHVAPHVKDMPMLEFFLPTSILTQVRFHRWEEVLDLPPPGEKLPITQTIWHYARGCAFAAKKDVAAAEKELTALARQHDAIADDIPYGDRNKARKVLVVPSMVLAARIAQAKKNFKGAAEAFESAIAAEDALNYIEPSDWHAPVRESLGGLYLASGEAARAERIFREDLERNRRNPRSLFGLMESLKAQGKNYDASMVEQQFRAAWHNADAKLRVEDL